MLNLNTWNLFTLPLNGGAAETAPDDLRLLAAVGDEARNNYLRGVSAIGNLIFWACDNPNYTDHKADLPALGAFLKHTADMARAAEFMAGHLDSRLTTKREANNATQTSFIRQPDQANGAPKGCRPRRYPDRKQPPYINAA